MLSVMHNTYYNVSKSYLLSIKFRIIENIPIIYNSLFVEFSIIYD